MPSLLGDLEGIDIVELSDEETEQIYPDGSPGAEDGDALGRAPRQLERGIVSDPPRRAGVEEGRDLRRQVGEIDEAESFGAEERQAELEIDDAEPGAEETVDSGAIIDVALIAAFGDLDRLDLLFSSSSKRTRAMG